MVSNGKARHEVVGALDDVVALRIWMVLNGMTRHPGRPAGDAHSSPPGDVDETHDLVPQPARKAWESGDGPAGARTLPSRFSCHHPRRHG